MKKALLLLLSAALTACGPRHTLTGRIEGLTNDTLIVQSCAIEDMPLLASDSDQRIAYDTIIAAKGELVYDIAVERPTQFILTPMQLMESHQGKRYSTNTSGMKCFLDKGERVVIEGRIDSTVFNCTLSGTLLNEDYSRHYRELLPFWVEGQRLQNAMTGKTRTEQEALYKKFLEVMERRQTCEMRYIAANPNHPLAGYCLRQASVDSVFIYYEQLGNAARNSIFRPLLEPLLAKAEKYRMVQQAKARIKAGAEAPDFTLERAGGGTFTLSSLRGKYVVLDFWGSWCGWCVKGFPEMKKVYARHKGRLEIVGIACNDTPEKWLAAISEHALPWINVLNPAGARPTEDIAVGYAVDGFPTKIIIDPEGRFVDSYTGEVPAFYEKLAELLK